jgi:hypothetical protein
LRLVAFWVDDRPWFLKNWGVCGIGVRSRACPRNGGGRVLSAFPSALFEMGRHLRSRFSFGFRGGGVACARLRFFPSVWVHWTRRSLDWLVSVGFPAFFSFFVFFPPCTGVGVSSSGSTDCVPRDLFSCVLRM